jgi:hypothetical protein
MVLGLLLFGASACSSFDPVKVKRFKLLYKDTYQSLGMSGAYWVEYDDQHSLTSACTNGAAGDHLPSEWSLVYAEWDSGAGGDGSGGSGGEAGIPKSRDPKCPPTDDELHRGDLPDPGPDGSICISGVLHPYQPCVHDVTQCLGIAVGDRLVDVSYMWGAGVGLKFERENSWDAAGHQVRGIAFEFHGTEKARAHLRVEIPILLAADTRVPDDRPIIRNDGSVLDTKGTIHSCNPGDAPQFDVERGDTLRDALVGEQEGDGLVTSELHPYGSPFWQEAQGDPDVPAWTYSPVQHGYNEVKWSAIQPPPELDTYPFTNKHILGVHFQVSYPTECERETDREVCDKQDDLEFGFCIEKLAVLFEE